MPLPLNDLVTVSQAAKRLHVSRQTLHRWIVEGRVEVADRLPGPTGALLLRRADVERLAR